MPTFPAKILCNYYNTSHYYRKMRPSGREISLRFFHSRDFSSAGSRLNQAQPFFSGKSPLEVEGRLEVKITDMLSQSTSQKAKESLDIGKRSAFSIHFLP